MQKEVWYQFDAYVCVSVCGIVALELMCRYRQTLFRESEFLTKTTENVLVKEFYKSM